ncbi:hypothetical protein VTO42DRAFT_6260 [Malbranchea cinnamomea]
MQLKKDHGRMILSHEAIGAVGGWRKHIRGGFGTLPVVVDSAKNAKITDTDGKEYIDFVAMYAVSNTGHANPRIMAAVLEQMLKAPVCNTSWINPFYVELAARTCKTFEYDSITTMVTGSEAAEAAVKIARKWAYLKKGLLEGEAWILTADGCFHGLTLGTMALSNVKAECPWIPSTGKLVEFGSVNDLREALEKDGHRIAAFMIEPIQGSAGVRVPPDGYLKAAAELCRKHNVLFIVDEVQTGFGRVGFKLAHHREPGVKPDMVILGKALTGGNGGHYTISTSTEITLEQKADLTPRSPGMYPMSMVMGTSEVMDVLSPWNVASTFAASHPACVAALTVLDIMEEEDLPARSRRLGTVLYNALKRQNLPHILEHRGKGCGLFQCLVIDESTPGVTARRVAALCVHRGLMIGQSKNRIRLTPALTISEEDLLKGVEILAGALRDVARVGEIPGEDFIFGNVPY